MTKFSEDINKTWLKATLKEIKILINHQTFLFQYPGKGEPVTTTCMGVYKAKNQSYGSLDNLRLRIVVRVDMQNKELVGDTWLTTAPMRTLKYFLAYAANKKEILH